MKNFRAYLKNSLEILNYKQTQPLMSPQIALVMGNRSADMDSVVGSLLFAYLLFLRDLKSTSTSQFSLSTVASAIDQLKSVKKYIIFSLISESILL